MTHRHALASILAIALVSVAVRPATTRAADLSEPKAAAMAFATAMMTNDGPGMHAAGIGNDEQWKVTETLAKLVVSQQKLSEAATAKFGAEAKMPVNNQLKNVEDKLKDADVAINGDEATITAKNPQPGSEPVKLKKEGGNWKVVLETMTGKLRGAGAGDPERLGKLADAMSELADDISAGKFATVAEMRQALMTRMAPLMQPARATSAPAAPAK